MVVAVGIVGAGPAGLVIAYLLQRDGIPFVLLERSLPELLGQRPKAGLIEYRTVELLRREGIADAILAFESENRRCEFRSPAGSIVIDYAALTAGRPITCTRSTGSSPLAPGGHRRGRRHTVWVTVDTVGPEAGGMALSGAGPAGDRSRSAARSSSGATALTAS